MKKIYTIALFLIGMSPWAAGQTANDPGNSESWILIKESTGIKVYYKEPEECINSSMVIFKIENTNVQEKSITFSPPSNVVNATAESNTTTIPGNTTLVGTCLSSGLNNLRWMYLGLVVFPTSQMISIN